MSPGTDYELYIQPWDKNGNNADYSVVNVTTQKMGGEGLAEMTISVGEFGGSFETGYYQYVTYTPNDQVSLHRDMLISKATFESPEWGEQGVLDYLKADNPYDPYWNQYGVDVVQWGVDPSTEYIAFSIAQNINGEWGPLVSEAFTTPAASPAAAPAVKGVAPALPVRKVAASGDFRTSFPKLTKFPVKKTVKLAE